jgi:hypothetical protein
MCKLIGSIFAKRNDIHAVYRVLRPLVIIFVCAGLTQAILGLWQELVGGRGSGMLNLETGAENALLLSLVTVMLKRTGQQIREADKASRYVEANHHIGESSAESTATAQQSIVLDDNAGKISKPLPQIRSSLPVAGIEVEK